ncbi:hypothetical protein [Pseudomonas sp. F01002]|uniref:hypothetical protein n=1 Tax=Pseudomonas sp. F01002 TaxID=2555724 RepID=UPI00106CE808|nr:hypothetical protein [Pseudomonas sp. F01002]TFB41447.1 hypothetical protein E3W21_09785 [Pseudomonas sp. F01002]
MGIYTFKEWLSFEDAAAWLSDATGESYDENSILRLALKGRVPVHYWPTDDAQIVLYRVEHDLASVNPVVEAFVRLDLSGCEPICLVDGPVPIRNFGIFFPSSQNNKAPGMVGLSAYPEEESGEYGCYRLGEDDRPQSIIEGRFEVLIHLSDLQQLRAGLPMPRARQPHDLIMGYANIDGVMESFPLARSTAEWSDYPDSDLPLPQLVGDPESKTEPLLRVLGLAAHLIADLGKQLDAHEQIESSKRRYMKGVDPNISRISQALADVASGIRLEGHNFKGAGFSKLLTKALRELE